MALSHRQDFLTTLGFDETARRIIKRLQFLVFLVEHAENLREPNGGKVLLIVGISNPIGGSTFASAAIQGTRYVPFVIRLASRSEEKTEILVYAAGSESVLATDYGRNKHVVEMILHGLPGTSLEPPVPAPPIADNLAWRDSAPGL